MSGRNSPTGSPAGPPPVRLSRRPAPRSSPLRAPPAAPPAPAPAETPRPPSLVQQDWRLDAFAVAHRMTESLGYRFQEEPRHPLIPARLAALGIPEGPECSALAQGRPSRAGGWAAYHA